MVKLYVPAGLTVNASVTPFVPPMLYPESAPVSYPPLVKSCVSAQSCVTENAKTAANTKVAAKANTGRRTWT